MGSAPAVSIVIPAYNAAAFVSAAIESARRQTFDDIEIIVIDDASTDATPAIIGALAQGDSRIRPIRLPRNAGPAASRNAGLAAARGSWIALLDADDSYAPSRIEVLLSRVRGGDIDVVADNVALTVDGVPNGLHVIPASRLTEPRMMTFAEFIDGAVIDPRAPRRVNHVFLKPMLRRDFLATHAIAYDEANRNGEDLLFYASCLAAGARWLLTPEPMYRYAVRHGSLTEIVTPEDSRRLIDQMTRLLDSPGVAGDRALRAAICRHIHAMSVARYFWPFKSAVSSADLRRAGGILLEDRIAAPFIARELMARAPAYCRRAMGLRAR